MLPNYRWKIYSFRCDFLSIKKPCCMKLISLATRNLNDYHLPPPPPKKKNQMPRERKKKKFLEEGYFRLLHHCTR